MNIATPPEKLTAKDFTSDQEVRWCPGCGDYAILKGVTKTLADIGTPRHKTVFVSGIGCAARFPYYVSTYGFHTIHGRAPAVATGIKLANPELDIWVVSGDGDAMSIGGNHLLHLLRRNIDLQFLLFNNEIYGLTKGQYSPTSRVGTRSPSTPMGSVEQPVSACRFALGAGARFVARAVDTQQKQMPGILMRAHAHKGTSFVEIFQNCIVYNDGAFDKFTDRAAAEDTQIEVRHGEPLIFGKDRDKGLRLKPGALHLEMVKLGENGITEADLMVHDETDRILAEMLVGMEPPMPVAVGVIYCNPGPVYEARLAEQTAAIREKSPPADLAAVMHRGDVWTVKKH
ncbi:MAG: 2-oxoacid:ferredoxin oxidoreductase subunit beta [Proteobacteria bacterium]|nr:2-oxoacid:ferredoxin oxidoreductase subunit beta [Pseudomonadota bacterium]